MAYRKTKSNARWRITRFVINFLAFTFDVFVTATLSTAGHSTDFNASGIITATISLVIALVIQVASVLVIRASYFLIIVVC